MKLVILILFLFLSSKTTSQENFEPNEITFKKWNESYISRE